MMRAAINVALITGVQGQDGVYLARHLLACGYRVIGTTRDMQAASLPDDLTKQIELIELNMLDQDRMLRTLASHRPREIYNLAAFSSGAGMFDNAPAIAAVNGTAVTTLLDAICRVDPAIRLCQASSSEMFGHATQTPQSEETSFVPRSPYGAAKVYAHSMIRIYRERYGLFACSAILFNHESPRRSLDFVTRKITHTAAMIKLGLAEELRLGNLEARRDWGFAGDYTRAMRLMLQHELAQDYVVASGQTHSVRELCECAFQYLELDYRSYVREDASAFRPAEQTQLTGNPGKIRKLLGWVPEIEFHELVKMMVDADLRMLTDKIGLNS